MGHANKLFFAATYFWVLKEVVQILTNVFLEDCFLFSFLTICMVHVFQNPVATAFEIFWMIFEPILFGLTGTQIKFNELKSDTVSIGMACLITGIVVSV